MSPVIAPVSALKAPGCRAESLQTPSGGQIRGAPGSDRSPGSGSRRVLVSTAAEEAVPAGAPGGLESTPNTHLFPVADGSSHIPRAVVGPQEGLLRRGCRTEHSC